MIAAKLYIYIGQLGIYNLSCDIDENCGTKSTKMKHKLLLKCVNILNSKHVHKIRHELPEPMNNVFAKCLHTLYFSKVHVMASDDMGQATKYCITMVTFLANFLLFGA